MNFIYNRACSVVCVPTDDSHTNRFNHLIAHTRHDIDTFNQYKGMVFNAGISTVASMLQLGTSQVK